MESALVRIWENLGGRISGPLSFRLILQPAMAAILAIRARIWDAHASRPPYFWTILTNAQDRAELLREGWTAVATRRHPNESEFSLYPTRLVPRGLHPGDEGDGGTRARSRP